MLVYLAEEKADARGRQFGYQNETHAGYQPVDIPEPLTTTMRKYSSEATKLLHQIRETERW